MRDTQTAHAASADTTTNYSYPPVNATGTGQPHTLTSTTNQVLTWNSEGKLATLTEGTSTTGYLYDASSNLLTRTSPTETVLYLGGQELHYDPVAKKFSAQRYFAAGDGTALGTNTGLSWVIDDHHGTASMIVDAATQKATRRYTKPFGEDRGSAPAPWSDDRGFLGKPADASTGLTHIGAREYAPETGRFLSTDPVLAPSDHESLNGYAYANNTPVTTESWKEVSNGDGRGPFYPVGRIVAPGGRRIFACRSVICHGALSVFCALFDISNPHWRCLGVTRDVFGGESRHNGKGVTARPARTRFPLRPPTPSGCTGHDRAGRAAGAARSRRGLCVRGVLAGACRTPAVCRAPHRRGGVRGRPVHRDV
ncbi:RHS repeat-associated core domain-containing protein [Streptomyces beijiangensis]|uniref:RHS repeat-associated core domain-containing protein n=2 Tax=Streptomyces beijiangensis TaxID=163361 RepID=UPI0031D51E49